MRTLAYLFAIALLACWTPTSCLAQQPTGLGTLENLFNSNEAPKTVEADASPKQPAGTVARPEGGVQHPDLDKAWAGYDVVVSKVAESVKTAIANQFDAATAKGDLDAAEKWQKAQEKFEKAGELPTEKETKTKTAVNAAVADYKKAKDELKKAYEAVVAALTMDKKIAEARAGKEELRVVFGVGDEVDGWSVLFHSDNPAGWPNEKSPKNVRFLRLKRSSNRQAIIIPMSDEMLGKNGTVSDNYGWAGSNVNNWGGHHLGVYLDKKVPPKVSDGGVICIYLDGFDVFAGWGFGHKIHAGDKQYFSWAGVEIPKECFEVSVKCSDLTFAEKKILRK